MQSPHADAVRPTQAASPTVHRPEGSWAAREEKRHDLCGSPVWLICSYPQGYRQPPIFRIHRLLPTPAGVPAAATRAPHGHSSVRPVNCNM